MTISVDSELLKWAEQLVNEKIFYNRSHAIEYCMQYIKQHKKVPLPDTESE